MLVLLDIDGTLLNSNHRIENETVEAISKYSNMNRFVLCSARKPSSTISIANQLRLNEKIIICYNGALIMEGERKIFERPLLREKVKNILEMAKAYSLTINVYCDDLWFANELDDFVFHESEIIGETPLELKETMDFKDVTVHKLLLLGVEDKLKLLKKDLKRMDGITFCNSKVGYLEITSYQANKRKAFEYLVQYLSVDFRDSLAIGDGYNDLELLQCVGNGIAMDNSPNDVKTVADYVTYSNNKNGVAFALNKFLN